MIIMIIIIIIIVIMITIIMIMMIIIILMLYINTLACSLHVHLIHHLLFALSGVIVIGLLDIYLKVKLRYYCLTCSSILIVLLIEALCFSYIIMFHGF